jgi:acetoin utilization protein AcuB
MHLIAVMRIPAISRFMTLCPWTIERTATLADAHELMRDHKIRHLPVVDNGELCGVISERDLLFYETRSEERPDAIAVDVVMTVNPFIVTSDTPLDEVAEIMGAHKYGSVVVVGRDGVEGIFTATDACEAFAQTLREGERETLMAGT